MLDKVKNHKLNLTKVIILIILLIIILSYIGIVIFNLIKNPTDTFMIENGNLYLEEETDGYILREEIIVQGDSYKNGIVKIKNEGEKVAKDEPIFRYKNSNEDELIKKIEELDVKIQEALKNETNTYSPVLEDQIQEKINSIYGMNNYSEIKVLKKK